MADTPPLLSDLIAGPSWRRAFLSRASTHGQNGAIGFLVVEP